MDEKPQHEEAEVGGSATSAKLVEETEDAILLKWPAKKDAQYYKIEVQRDDKDSVITKSSVPKYEFKNQIYSWKKGEKIHAIIKSVSKDNTIDSLHDVGYVVGGGTVVCGVCATEDPEHPQNILLTWEKPIKEPLEYEIVVYKTSSGKEKQRRNCKATQISIKGLRQCVDYHCHIIAKYSDSKVEKAVTSQNFKTLEKQLPGVKVQTDPDNPIRQIIVNWEDIKPGFKAVAKYQVHLEFKRNGIITTTKKLTKPKDSREIVFKDLTSNTAYTAFVTAYNKKGESEKFVSKDDAATTKSAHRLDDFDIRETGKPKIQTCQIKSIKGKLMSNLTWELADIGKEKENYKLTRTAASYKKSGSTEKPLEVENNSAKPVELKRGMTYSFEVKCTYLDLDSRETFDAVDQKFLETEIGKMKLKNVTWADNKITVNWSQAEGAVSYKITVLDERKELVLTERLQATFYTFQMSHSCTYGKTCTFEVEASGALEMSTKDSTTALIGRDKAVTKAVATKDVENPRRGISVQWKKPTRNPLRYRLELYECQQQQRRLIREVETKNTVYKFGELKTKTRYQSKIIPVYKDGKAGGTWSCVVETDQRITRANESKRDFGVTQEIIENLVLKEAEIEAKLRWTKVDLGENYKLLNFNVEVHAKSNWTRFFDTSVFCKKLHADCYQVNVPQLKMGNRYGVKVKTIYIDLDNPKDEKEALQVHKFDTSPNDTNLLECTWQNKNLCFTWIPVNGAVSYTLTIKDCYLKENLVPDYTSKVTKDNDGCYAEMQTTENLRIGKTCMARVRTHTESNLTSDSEWKTYLIGGPNVPRNVTASVNNANPRRSARITFDAPEAGQPEHYIIVAKPVKGGREKIQKFDTSPAVFEYLRQGTSYIFQVKAVKGNDKSEESASNKVTTAQDGMMKPMHEFHGSGGEYNFQHSNFQDNKTIVNIVKGEEFGKVRNVQANIDGEDECDKLSLEWIVPSFDNRATDYKVEEYCVRIQGKDDPKAVERTVKFEKDKQQYRTQPVNLRLDTLYEIGITTIYEDIDRDEYPLLSSAYKPPLLYTRPSKPCNIKSSWDNEELVISWNPVKGDVTYELEIVTKNPSSTLLYKTGTEAEWRQPLGPQIGYGMSYYAVVRVIHKMSNKSNSSQTAEKTIGGSYVPRNVSASNKGDEISEPNTQIFLQWDEPEEKPYKYEVESDPESGSLDQRFSGCTCLVSGLKAGTIYRFKVAALHKIDGRDQKSGASLSNDVKTDPKPTQVKNVRIIRDKNPGSCRKVVWDKVDAEKDEESTVYRITIIKCVKHERGQYKQEINASCEETVIRGLDPGESYKVMVAGGNSEGYGRDSEEVVFETDYGMPKNCSLEPCKNSPSTSLQLQFQEADGKPDEYRAVLCKAEYELINEDANEEAVLQGHIYANLIPNTTYYVKMHAIFCKNKGNSVTSSHVKTAPSWPRITDSKHVEECGKTSRELFVEWESVPGCTMHEVMIKRKKSGEKECLMSVNNKNWFRYACQLEATDYLVEVRSKNDSDLFGPWSEAVVIKLAPAKLQNITAELDSKSNGIIVRTTAVERESIFHYIQAMCDGKKQGDPRECKVKSGEELVQYHLEKPIPARLYTFEMWSENSLKMKGERSVSNSVTSRPERMQLKTLKRLESTPSTDIFISWEKQNHCDSYELMISITVRDKIAKECLTRIQDASCVYRCQSPGRKYAISIRALCNFVPGDWSPDEYILLAPEEVILEESDAGTDAPSDCLEIKWKPLKVTPDGYLITLYEGKDKIDEHRTKENECNKHVFKEKLKPGALCYCTVAAFNSEVEGKPSKSRTYRIAWSQPCYFSIVLDDNDPSKKAKMMWDKPDGVNCFKLRIENCHTGLVDKIKLKENTYAFQSGIPGNSYIVKLYCGCDSRYDLSYIQNIMTMDPAAPCAITASAVRSSAGLLVEIKDRSEMQKHYEVTLVPTTTKTEKKTITTKQNQVLLKDLIPGESYSLAVVTIVGDARSKATWLDGYIETIPDTVKNLKSYEENGCIIFEWDSLKVPPHEYIVQWRVDNDPITEDQTTETRFEISFKKPAHRYSVRVKGCNSSGAGKMSGWVHFTSNPSPPCCVQVYPDPEAPETSLIVKFKDEKDSLKSYRVMAEGPEDEPKIVDTYEHFAILSQLQPGRQYMVKVKTLFCGKESKWAHFSRISS